MSKSKRPPADPIFAAEMAAAADERHQIFTGTFRQEWKERLEREKEVGSLYPSTLHQHEDSCWSDPYDTSILGKYLRVRRCLTTGVIKEVP